MAHGAVQIIGYICRILAHDDNKSIPIYSVQTILILLAPPLYAASIYMTLGRLIRYLGAESQSLIPTKWLTKIFLVGDVVAFLMQAAGLFDPLRSFTYPVLAVCLHTNHDCRRWYHGEWHYQGDGYGGEHHHRRFMRPAPLFQCIHHYVGSVALSHSQKPYANLARSGRNGLEEDDLENDNVGAIHVQCFDPHPVYLPLSRVRPRQCWLPHQS